MKTLTWIIIALALIQPWVIEWYHALKERDYYRDQLERHKK